MKDKIIAILVVAVMIIPSLQPLASLASPETVRPQAFIDPRLMLDDTYTSHENVLTQISGVDFKYYLDKYRKAETFDLRHGQVKVVVTALPSLDPETLQDAGADVIFGFNLGKISIYTAWVSKDTVMRIASTPGVVSISLYQPPVDNIIASLSMASMQSRLDPKPQPAIYKAVDVLGVTKVWNEFNITGEGVVVGVVDSGVDFGIADLGSEAIARENGIPLLIDSDEIGITLTTAEANRSGDIITIPTPVLFIDGFFLEAGYTDQGWLIYLAPNGNISILTFDISTFNVSGISSGATIKFGLSVQTQLLSYGGLGILQYTLPVIVTDSNNDGLYDTVYADTSTVYYLFLLALNQTGMVQTSPDPAWFDLSFADEKPVTYGDEVIARDFNGDGENDFSGGALAGYLYDWIGVFTGLPINSPGWNAALDMAGLILPGMDVQGGNYVSFVYDFIGHGTSVASVIAGRGKTVIDLGYGQYRLTGIAPKAKLGANTGLINPYVSQLFFAGLDQAGYPWNWTYTGNHKVDIISNSWGLSAVGLIGFMSTMDPLSMLEDYIVANTGTIVVHAMGNGGPGYGTATIPGSSTLAISVGASTLFDYRQYYGYLPGAWGEVVSWSDRGPTNLGLAKPDVVNIGSFAWARAPVLTGLGDGAQAYDLFGGTSEATPMTSGTVALIVEAFMKATGEKPSPGLVKTVLKSTATDLGYDPYVQGSGHVNAYKAVKAVLEGGIPIASTTATFENAYQYAGINMQYLPEGNTLSPVSDTQVYTGVMKPGEGKEVPITINTLGGTTYASVEAVTYKQYSEPLTKYLKLDEAIVYTTEGIFPLTDLLQATSDEGITILLNYTRARILIPIDMNAFQGADLVEIVASYPYSKMDPLGRQGYYVPFLFTGVELQYWIDANGDGQISLLETARMNYDIRMANVFHITLGKPAEKFSLVENVVSEYLGTDVTTLDKAPLLDIRILMNQYPLLGIPLSLNINLELRKTVEQPWSWISVPSTIDIADSPTTLVAKINVPSSAKPGLYQGYIKVTYNGDTLQIPVSIPVAATITGDTKALTLAGTEDTPYKNYAVEGQFDWTWRYESGDWRTIPITTTDPTIVGYVITVEWEAPNTNIDVMLAGEGVPILTTSLFGYGPESSFYGAVVAGKLSLPLTGGWFTHYDRPFPQRAVIVAPIFSQSPYWIVLHNTLIDASNIYPEPYKITVIPIRANVPTIQLQPGEETIVEVTISGTFLLSGAFPYTTVTSGDACAKPLVDRTNFGNEITVPIKIRANTTSTINLMLVSPVGITYTVGLTLNGIEMAVFEIPAFIVVPINVNVG
ncbi:MAG: S8 family serine peptidase [Desulfurococcales archaeon]|nr:S8 family serine peptidase [Desulfurococcales archaeon]